MHRQLRAAIYTTIAERALSTHVVKLKRQSPATGNNKKLSRLWNMYSAFKPTSESSGKQMHRPDLTPELQPTDIRQQGPDMTAACMPNNCTWLTWMPPSE